MLFFSGGKGWFSPLSGSMLVLREHGCEAVIALPSPKSLTLTRPGDHPPSVACSWCSEHVSAIQKMENSL